MNYRAEFARHWRYLLAASLGMTAGYNLSSFLANLFTPHLLEAFGWTKAQFSLVGLSVLMTVALGPLAGRLIDRFGTRPVATLGVLAMPLVFLAFSLVNGDFRLYLALAFLQVAIPGLTTTTIVYSRLIRGSFTSARGIALGIMVSATALLAAILAQPLAHFIDAYGWRAGYRVLAVLSALLGIAALAAIPREHEVVRQADSSPSPAARPVFASLFREPAFRILMAGMLLCNVTLVTNSTHLKVMLLDRHMAPDAATSMIALFSVSVVAGRIICGLALDRFPVHLAAFGVMVLPALGLWVLALGVEAPAVLALAVATMGFAVGADGDLMAFTSMRFFGSEVYSSVLGFAGSAVAGSGALGALLLGATLASTGSFTLFLAIAALAMTLGACVFLFLGNVAPAQAAVPAE